MSTMNPINTKKISSVPHVYMFRAFILTLMKLPTLGLIVVFSMLNVANGIEPEHMLELPEIVFYVSVNGNDLNDGSFDAPFKTFTAARDKVREVRDGSTGISYTVWIRGGVYELTESFTIGTEDGGTADSPVSYKAYNGEIVRILGGKEIDNDLIVKVSDESLLGRLTDPLARDHLYSLNLAGIGITDFGERKQQGFGLPLLASELELFIGEETIMPARWPNEGLIKIRNVLDSGSVPRNNDLSGRGGEFELETDRHKSWMNFDNLWVAGFFNHGYAEDSIKVAKLDESKNTVKLATPHLYGIQAKPEKDWHGYYFLNVFEEIDRHGEGYLDLQNGVYYFRWDKDFEGSKIAISLIEEPLFALYDTEHVTIDGLDFEATRGMGLNIIGGESNLVENCSVINIGTAAVVMGNGSMLSGDNSNVVNTTGDPTPGVVGIISTHIYSDTMWKRGAGKMHGVTNSRIHNTGSGGIFLSGGDRATLDPGRCFAINNDISNYNRRYKFAVPGVWIDGVGNLVSYNYIHDADMFGISVKGNEHIIEYNKIARVSREGDDNAAFYLGRDPSERGNRVRYNYFKDIGNETGSFTHAVYNDDGACGTKIYGNTFYNGGKGATVFYCGGSDLESWNNIFIESEGTPIAGSIRLQTWASGMLTGGLFERRLKAMDFQHPPFSDYYPEVARYFDESPEIPKRNKFVKNLLFDCDALVLPEPGFGIEFKHNYVTAEDPGFVDLVEQNFQLKDDSDVYEIITGFEKIDFTKAGNTSDDDYFPTQPRILPPVKRNFNGLMEIELYTIPASAEIRYTLDGTSPDLDATLYTAPFAIDSSASLRAIAVNPAKRGNVSRVSSAEFTRDDKSPNAVENLRAPTVRKDIVELVWDRARDNVGIAGYYVYRSDSLAGLVNEVNLVKPYLILNEGFEDREPLTGRRTYYSVVSVDAAGNTSEGITITTNVPAADSKPYNDLALSAQSGQSSILLHFPGDRPSNWKEIRIMRKAYNQAFFNNVGRIQRTDPYIGNYYYDREVQVGACYDYYVELVDDTGDVSEPSVNVCESVAELPRANGWILPKDSIEWARNRTLESRFERNYWTD